MVEYTFLFDENFLINSYQKYRKQHGARPLLRAFKVIASLLLMILAVVSIFHNLLKLALFFSAFTILMFCGHHIDYWLYKRRFRKSPYCNENVVIHLTPDGCHVVCSKSDSKLTWSAFTKALQFRDGFLLFQGPGLFNWLPESTITQGTAAEAESFIKENVKDYKIVERS